MRGAAGAAVAATLLAAPAAWAAGEVPAPTVREVVVTPAPAGGPGVEADKLPGAVETLGEADLARAGSPVITDVLEQRAAGVSLSDVQGNGFARALNYRGFSASPLQGTPQGLAVYLGGVRLNEAFGDTVNWDLIPEAAVSRIDLVTGDPAFGLNALGGALTLSMKTGRDAPGGTASAEGGSFGRAFGTLEYGWSAGAWSAYGAVDGGREDGWRRRSGSSITRAYGDLGWRSGPVELHLVAAAGATDLGVVGPTPKDLLPLDRRATFTFPQTTRDEAQLVALNGSYAAAGGWTLQGGLYGRAFRQRHLDGNDGDFEGCSPDPASSLFATLCVQDDAFPSDIRPPAAAFQVQDLAGRPIGCPPLVAGQAAPCDAIPYGTLDRTRTRSETFGVSLGAANNAPLFGRTNAFAAGLSLDEGRARFSAESTLAVILPSLEVSAAVPVPGAGQAIRTGGGVAYDPVAVSARSEAFGAYATDTLDLTDRLFLTVGGRFNLVRISIADRTGGSPELNGRHRFDRFNPAAGLAWRFNEAVTAYGGYAETNRAPTPLELSCSDPLRPCLLENALVSDPQLKQVVSRTWQAGLRGRGQWGAARAEWRLGVFRSDNDDDILALASAIQGRGSFANVPKTRRQGGEAELTLSGLGWRAYLAASETEATYRFAGAPPSPNSPFADPNGDVQVRPGDRIGGVPPGRLKAGGEWDPTPWLTVGADVLAVSAQRRVGDEANQDAKLPAYWTAGLHATWRLGRGLELFGRIDNLFDRRYATYGTYFATDALANLAGSPLPADPDPRTDTPAPPRSFQLGLRVRW